MSTETIEPETIGHMLTRLRLLVEDRADSELLRHVIIGRFETVERERDEAIASLNRERAATKTSTITLRAELDVLIAEIDKVRRERREVLGENIRTANVVVDLRARIRELNEANLLLKQQLRAQEAVAQQATAVASTPAPADDDLDSTAWQRVARDLGDELLRARHIIAVQAARLKAATKRPADSTPSTQDSP